MNTLIEALKVLPGVGKKTAQRMMLSLVDKNTEGAKRLAHALSEAVLHTRRCSSCQMLTEHEVCVVCKQESRHTGQLCVVETMLDLIAIESSEVYRGQYFVLHGRLSPLDGIGPRELRLSTLEKILETDSITELVMALSPSIEGETTAHFIVHLLKKYPIKVTKLGFGVPFGGELEYLDSQTLQHAFNGRRGF